ncbi:hypothetical protein O1R50_23335 [Glycomyces luteolus]|uniref:Uncharacterized protein n=1 Tax=Glycomyces luteolus TaxID=2670330 RepID=A0A9X3SSH3_9ACTN|nr:hypothetical protein [Glycomyces luteolus]MDA1362576.1 hypothetical protein [Glycomyces luteolus]
MTPLPPGRPDKLTVFARFLQFKLRLPVIVAVCASVPAVFLTLWSDGEMAMAGKVIGWAAGIVLWAESVILLLAAERKREWLWRHKWMLVVCLLTLVSLVVAAGGAQVLRLVTLVGSIRVLRAKRIFNAAQVLGRRFGIMGGWRSWAVMAAGGIAALFTALVLVDPTSQYLELLDWLGGNLRLIPILVAGVILAVATWLVVRAREEGGEADAVEREAE